MMIHSLKRYLDNRKLFSKELPQKTLPSKTRVLFVSGLFSIGAAILLCSFPPLSLVAKAFVAVSTTFGHSVWETGIRIWTFLNI